jgi:hypothetical protein
MAVFTLLPAAEHLRRTEGIGFILADGAEPASARMAAQQLIGGTSIQAFAGVPIGVQPVAIQGLPVAEPSSTTWPRVTHIGGFLEEVA